MIELIAIAFSIGLSGSLHCIGMCGPIAIALPINKETNNRKLRLLTYNSGRIFTYASLGLLFGWIGKTFALFGFQQTLSIIIGSSILFVILFPKNISVKIFSFRFLNQFFKNVRARIALLFSRKSYHSLFFLGFLNGLLPCGLIYFALAGAIATADVIKSILFMLAFGLGTLPMMFLIGYFKSSINFKLRLRLKKFYSYAIGIMACLLILRGLGLGIPFVSPKITNHLHIVIGCSEKH